ncbi:serine-rich adhesin for platelets [Musca domestica]|uniref:Serine-rich adhesin for platelets n=1 Tax=Musca domestica TaxID=7370 RepID=A0A9J7I175_MUSDO|nr:serine-rich adhesin for platelets [Musca domestica]
MSSSLASSNQTVPVSTMAGSNSVLPSLIGSRSIPPAAAAVSLHPQMAAQFREIHKNTWLKRLTAEGKKICVGPKKCERSWVVFCVHDDTEALLEGYAEPRQAPSHNPEWVVSLQDTLHISHALIPNSHEFEFVVTLSNEVLRFHAMSWDIMQEWVETLRSKLREMKILSPRENLYTKLPEVRLPLLPTRDPTSPLPAPPPVPAAIVPGVERIIPPSLQQQQQHQNTASANDNNTTDEAQNETDNTTAVSTSSSTSTNDRLSINSTTVNSIPSTTNTISTTSSNSSSSVSSTNVKNIATTSTPLLTSMSNTLTQNLLNMLSDPISAYSEQINDANSSSSSVDLDEISNVTTKALTLSLESGDLDFSGSQAADEECIGPLLRKPNVNPGDFANFACGSFNNNSVRLDVLSAHRASADHVRNLENILQCERRIPRPQTSRSLSVGAVDVSSNQLTKHCHKPEVTPTNDTHQPLVVANSSCRGNNVTELEVNSDFETQLATASSSLADSKTNITIIQVSTNMINGDKTSTCDSDYEPPELPQKTSNAEIFTFPDTHIALAATSLKHAKQFEYKSNVQIIPSSSTSNSSNSNISQQHNSSTIQVIGDVTAVKSSVGGNQYTTPAKKTTLASVVPASSTNADQCKITTVHVAGTDNAYGTCFTPPSNMCSTSAPQSSSTPKMPKKIILSANTSGVTNITVNNSNEASSVAMRRSSVKEEVEKTAKPNNRNNSMHYEKVFLSSTANATVDIESPTSSTSNACLTSENIGAASSSSSQQQSHALTPMSPKWNSPLRHAMQNKTKVDLGPLSPITKSSVINGVSDKKPKGQTIKPSSLEQPESRVKSGSQVPSDQPITSNKMASPALQRRRIVSPSNAPPGQMPRPPFLLRRGLTEAVITARPSRRDFHVLNKMSSSKTKNTPPSTNVSSKSIISNSNNNGDIPGPSAVTQTPTHVAINRTASDAVEQRRRSSSTSDAQGQRNSRGANNNEFSNRSNPATGGNPPLRQPPQPFRISDNILGGSPGGHHNSTASPTKRMTLREQQVMQLRREIMHPGGVRLQLRRKDCVGSIAWVDAFGAVWVAGWKQKEHPVLYNALHIGDQLLSIAGVTITSAAEANKIIRNTNTLFVEVLVRRIPFGRGYAIRREREGQCLGLIRDGNTATIVDVVPNSLAARHGLPPKAQSCDGTTLTFWVLTEINGRPLNLFFKDNEIRDRLNSVGRDISILVQPSDLITKLKKQLKSLRGYKDYLVQ